MPNGRKGEIMSAEVNETLTPTKERGRRFHEKGKANRSGSYGKAHIICDLNGLPLTLQLIKFGFDNTNGGQHYLWSPNIEREFSTSYTSTEGLYHIVVERRGSIADCTIREFIGEDKEVKFSGNCKIILEHTEIESVHQDYWMAKFDSTMENGSEAAELAEGKLSNAVTAAIARSLDNFPKNIYFGKIAMDVKGIKVMPYSKSNKKVMA